MIYFAGLRDAADFERAKQFIQSLGGTKITQDPMIPKMVTFEYKGKADIREISTDFIEGFAAGDDPVHLVEDDTPQQFELGVPVVTAASAADLVKAAHATIGIVDRNYKLRGEGVDVFVLDTGVSPHPDLPEVNKCTLNGVEFPWEDDNGHGTHCAGTIVSPIYGIADKATLYGVKVLDASGSGTNSGIVEGIKAIIETRRNNGFRPAVVNMSFAGRMYRYNPITIATQQLMAEGCIVVAAAGNNGANLLLVSDIIPAEIPGVLAVSAVDNNKAMASFSNFWVYCFASAPGVTISSTWYEGGSATMNGTSMAAPHVSGVVAGLLGTVDYKMYWQGQTDKCIEILKEVAVVVDEDMTVPDKSSIEKLLLNGAALYGEGIPKGALAFDPPEPEPLPEPLPEPEPEDPNKSNKTIIIVLTLIALVSAFVITNF